MPADTITIGLLIVAFILCIKMISDGIYLQDQRNRIRRLGRAMNFTEIMEHWTFRYSPPKVGFCKRLFRQIRNKFNFKAKDGDDDRTLKDE